MKKGLINSPFSAFNSYNLVMANDVAFNSFIANT